MFKAGKKTGLVFFPAFDWAIDPTHPEREERLLYTQDQVMEEGIFDINGIKEYKPDIVTLEDIRRVHFCVPDENTVTTKSHLISAGGATAIARAVMEKKVEKGFALVRPPGHHAMRITHGCRGFCHINIEAIMIEYIRQKYKIKKVAVVDTDCHHGDGTNDIYWHDPDTLFISIHQDGRTMYPGSGFPNELGGPNAKCTNLNIPLPPGTSSKGYLYILKNSILPALNDFKPEIIINSAGQDNHYTDPLTNMKFSAQGYALLTKLLKPDIAVLEGGYSIEGALPYVNLGIILAMAELDYSKVIEPDYNAEKLKQDVSVTDKIKKTSDIINKYWEQRHEITEKQAENHGKFAETHKEVFYDTDNIFERQKERIRICRDCAGVLEIDSSASTNPRISAIHIPFNACNTCIETGYKIFEKADLQKYKKVFLQDRPKDVYKIKEI
ncbi:MAG: histone deacetylase [Desulfobacteraceae bacterium 4572_130]|nr:MAG: histone deacetylase [Desulfobacteraceae bacterium 4572_130]